jgi:sarcosine oxidase gamma subunit
MKSARPSEEVTSAREQGQSKPAAAFLGTDNPRHLRVIQALTVRPTPREELDHVAGCSNGPALVADLRSLGLELPCTRARKTDRDMFTVWPGVYHLTSADRSKLTTWKRKRARGQGQS